MGLPCHVSHFSTDPILLLITIIAEFFFYLPRRIYAIFHSLGFRFKWRPSPSGSDEDVVVVSDHDQSAGSGDSNLLLLDQQLPSSGRGFGFDDDEDNYGWGRLDGSDMNLRAKHELIQNRLNCEVYGFNNGEPAGGSCVVCLSCLREGEQVRRLECRHVFHKQCFDGWLDHLNFNCPLCRMPLIMSEEGVPVPGGS